MVVLATLGGSNSEWHTDKKEVVRPGDMPNTNGGATGWPFAVQWGSFSFAPAVRSSWDWEKRPSDPSLERFHLQFIE